MKVGDLVTVRVSALESGICSVHQGDVGIVIAMKPRPFQPSRVETTVAWNGERGTGRYWSSVLEVISENR